MSRLKLHLLGAAQLLRDGAPVEMDTRKALALLAYLVVSAPGAETAAGGEPGLGRDILAALLWPDYDQVSARAALRRTLSTLHKALENAHLDIRRETIGLLPGSDLWVDVRQFHQRLAAVRGHRHDPDVLAQCVACLQALEEASELYRGDFMAGLSLRDSPKLDDWQATLAEALGMSWPAPRPRRSLTGPVGARPGPSGRGHRPGAVRSGAHGPNRRPPP